MTAKAWDDFECAKCRVYATLPADIAYHSVGRHELRAPQPTETPIDKALADKVSR